jgi:DUF4097 and DUF4098 domain-containing protein YvlB
MRVHARDCLAVLSLFAAAAAHAQWDACKVSADRSGQLDLAGIEKVVILAGAGDLQVTGSSSASRIEARGKACASSQEMLDQTRLTVRRDGSIATIETNMPEKNDGISSIDLEVSLPSSLPVEAQDSSGDARLKGLKSLSMQDSSGDLEIEGIAEAATVRDSSGDIDIENAASVRLEDSSGDIEVEEIRGDVEVTSDSSGEIRIEEIGGKVHIAQDSSGGIHIARVKGSVTIDTDSSGAIVVDTIGGDFTVTDDSSGGVKHRNVTGKVSVP